VPSPKPVAHALIAKKVASPKGVSLVLLFSTCATRGVLQVPIDLPSPLFALVTFSDSWLPKTAGPRSFLGQEAGSFHPNIKFSSLPHPSTRERFQTRCSSSREVSPIHLLLESTLSFANGTRLHLCADVLRLPLFRPFDTVSHYPMLTTCYPSRRTQGTRAVRQDHCSCFKTLLWPRP
jgi:hypothetical protein